MYGFKFTLNPRLLFKTGGFRVTRWGKLFAPMGVRAFFKLLK
jgi:hypothetical protein